MPAAIDVLFWLHSADAAWYRESRVDLHGELLARYPEQVRQLMEWGLPHREGLLSQFPHTDALQRARYMIGVLSVVGDEGSRALLQGYLLDPDLASAAVDAIRVVERRDR